MNRPQLAALAEVASVVRHKSNMNIRISIKLRSASWALIALVALLSGCAESQRPTATGKGHIRGINSILTAPDVFFLIEERGLGVVGYKESSAGTRFDDLSYLFNYDYQFPGDLEATRIISHEQQIVKDTDYIFVLTGTLSAPSMLVWEQAERIWDGSETVLEANFGHLSTTLGTVDVYFDTTGTAPAAGNAIGTFSYGERLPGLDVVAANYQLTLTTPGDPAAILYQTQSVTMQNATTVLFAVFDPDPSTTSVVNVHLINNAGTSSAIADLTSLPTFRIMHASLTTENQDAYSQGDFTAPIVADIGFLGLSEDVDVVSGDSLLTLTPAGNSGVIQYESTISMLANRRHTLMLSGPASDLTWMSLLEDRRGRETIGRFRIAKPSLAPDTVDVYILQPGTPVDADAFPRVVGMPTLLFSDYLQLIPGDFEVSVTVSGSKTVVAGPLPISIASGEVIEAAIVDTVDPTMQEIVLYD